MKLVGTEGIEPSTSFLSGMRSATELRARLNGSYFFPKKLLTQMTATVIIKAMAPNRPP